VRDEIRVPHVCLSAVAVKTIETNKPFNKEETENDPLPIYACIYIALILRHYRRYFLFGGRCLVNGERIGDFLHAILW
jgi:hypothetical protein